VAAPAAQPTARRAPAPGTSAGAPDAEDAVDPPANVLEVLARSHHTRRGRQLFAIAPRTRTGRAAAGVIALYPAGRFPAQHAAETGPLVEQIAVLRASPVEGLRDIRATLAGLPERFTLERQFIVQIAAGLGADPAAVVAFLADEVQRTFATGADGHPPDGFYDASVALDAMIDRHVDHTPDPKARRVLLRRYERQSTEGAARLRQAYLPLGS
jgi:hypothetical protein